MQLLWDCWGRISHNWVFIYLKNGKLILIFCKCYCKNTNHLVILQTYNTWDGNWPSDSMKFRLAIWPSNPEFKPPDTIQGGELLPVREVLLLGLTTAQTLRVLFRGCEGLTRDSLAIRQPRVTPDSSLMSRSVTQSNSWFATNGGVQPMNLLDLNQYTWFWWKCERLSILLVS